MATDKNVETVRQLYDVVFSKHNIRNIRNFISENFEFHDQSVKDIRGVEGFEHLETSYTQAFPDKKTEITDIFSTDDAVIVRWKCTGTHKGALQDIPATNNKIDITGTTIFRFKNGKITELRQNWDRLGLLEQLGIIQPITALHARAA